MVDVHVNLDGVKGNHGVKYLGQRSFYSTVISVNTQTQQTYCSMWTMK